MTTAPETTETTQRQVTWALGRLEAYLDDLFIERGQASICLIMGLLTGFPVTLISPPGTAKTALVKAFFTCIGGRSFGRLMTRYTTPDELVGGFDLAKLAQGTMERNTAGTIVGADAVFLDECFKANSATLNAQLGMMNEREFDGMACPWLAWVGASNEYPDGVGGQAQYAGDSLEALWDRYVIRHELEYIQDSENLRRMAFAPQSYNEPPVMSRALIEAARKEIAVLEFPEDAQRQYIAMIAKLRAAGVQVSDRKVVQGVRVMRARAYYFGRAKAGVRDMDWLKAVLWNSKADWKVVINAIDEAMPQTMRIAESTYTEARAEYARLIRNGKPLASVTKAMLGEGLDRLKAFGEHLKKMAEEDPGDEELQAYIAERQVSLRKWYRDIAQALSREVAGGV
jgi:MoxR-like ATPase